MIKQHVSAGEFQHSYVSLDWHHMVGWQPCCYRTTFGIHKLQENKKDSKVRQEF
jgi:hypothetical protein